MRDGHHNVLTAIECRDTGRPVGVPAVEAFTKKCEKTGIHRGVIVSASGFSETARAKAAASFIECLTLAEADAFDWMGIDFFVGFHRNFEHIDAAVFFVGGNNPSEPFTLHDTTGAVMGPQHLLGVVERALLGREKSEEQVGKEIPVSVRAITLGWVGTDCEDKSYPVDFIELEASFTTIRTVNPVSLHAYTGEGVDYAIASTKVDVGDKAGRLMFIRDDKAIRVLWAPDESAASD
jgi:hypothetical protein